MKNYINLLPKEEQKEITLEKLNTNLLNLFIWVVISLVVLSLLFVAARVYLSRELSQASEQIELRRQVLFLQENKDLKKQLQEFNTTLGNLVTLDENQGFWSDVVLNFAALIPHDVSVDNFSADRETGLIRISGFAKERNSVLELRNNLLGSDYFEDVNFPLSNLVRPTDVNFHYSFYVEEEKLLKNKKD